MLEAYFTVVIPMFLFSEHELHENEGSRKQRDSWVRDNGILEF